MHRSERAQGGGYMERLMLVLVLWVSLASMELKGGKTTVPASNLSCLQCFKVNSISQCLPVQCRITEKVCVSHKLIIYTTRGGPGFSDLEETLTLCYAYLKVTLSSSAYEYTAEGLRMNIQISKRCAPRCPNFNNEYEWMPSSGVQARIIRGCCSKNLCNKASTRQEGLWVRLGELLTPVGLSFLWTLL
ncbi:lymphocyte antigen 6L [Cavia porcellus]|uniref:lymphocyte antigen 6L n=1 Tax=Cavia porcellus TaxID=10141 RepID=UPI002FE14652